VVAGFLLGGRVGHLLWISPRLSAYLRTHSAIMFLGISPPFRAGRSPKRKQRLAQRRFSFSSWKRNCMTGVVLAGDHRGSRISKAGPTRNSTWLKGAPVSTAGSAGDQNRTARPADKRLKSRWKSSLPSRKASGARISSVSLTLERSTRWVPGV